MLKFSFVLFKPFKFDFFFFEKNQMNLAKRFDLDVNLGLPAVNGFSCS